MFNVLCLELELKINDIFFYLGCGKYMIRYVELIVIGSGLVVDILGFSLLDFIDIEVEDFIYCFLELKEVS